MAEPSDCQSADVWVKWLGLASAHVSARRSAVRLDQRLGSQSAGASGDLLALQWVRALATQWVASLVILSGGLSACSLVPLTVAALVVARAAASVSLLDSLLATLSEGVWGCLLELV